MSPKSTFASFIFDARLTEVDASENTQPGLTFSPGRVFREPVDLPWTSPKRSLGDQETPLRRRTSVTDAPSRAIPRDPSDPERSRAVPSGPERSRAADPGATQAVLVPSAPERSRAVPSRADRSGHERALALPNGPVPRGPARSRAVPSGPERPLASTIVTYGAACPPPPRTSE